MESCKFAGYSRISLFQNLVKGLIRRYLQFNFPGETDKWVTEIIGDPQNFSQSGGM